MKNSAPIVATLAALLLVATFVHTKGSDDVPHLRLTVQDDQILVVQNPAWKDNTFRYRLPEFVVSTQTNDMVLRPSPVKRTQKGSIVIAGGAYQESRLFASYRIVVADEPDAVAIEATVTNNDSTPWNPGTYSTLCLENASAPDFSDFTGSQTSIIVGADFMSLDRTAHGRAWDGSAPLHHAHVLSEEDGKWLREYVIKYFVDTEIVSGSLIVRSTKDGTRHIGVAWNDSRHVSYNLNKKLNCIHSEPRVGALESGESQTVRGKIYFVEGPIDEVMQRFKTDFPTLGYGNTATTR